MRVDDVTLVFSLYADKNFNVILHTSHQIISFSHLSAADADADYTDVELIYCRGCFNIRHNIDHTALTATVRVRRRHHQEVTTTTLDARVIASLIDAAFQSG